MAFKFPGGLIVAILLLFGAICKRTVVCEETGWFKRMLRPLGLHDSSDSTPADPASSFDPPPQFDPTPLTLLWGIPDTQANVGTLFKFTIPKNAFQGHVDYYQVQMAGENALPTWLYFNQTAKTFFGVPSPLDVGPVAIIAKAIQKDTEITTHFIIRVISKTHHMNWWSIESDEINPIKMLQGQPRDQKPLCTLDKNLIRATLILDTTFSHLTAHQRVQIIQLMSNFLTRSEHVIHLVPKRHKTISMLLKNDILVAGPGNIQHSSKEGTELSWIVGCQGNSKVNDLANVIEHNVQGGRFAAELQHNIIGWYISAMQPPLALRRLKRHKRAAMLQPTPMVTPAVELSPSSQAIAPTSTIDVVSNTHLISSEEAETAKSSIPSSHQTSGSTVTAAETLYSSQSAHDFDATTSDAFDSNTPLSAVVTPSLPFTREAVMSTRRIAVVSMDRSVSAVTTTVILSQTPLKQSEFSKSQIPGLQSSGYDSTAGDPNGSNLHSLSTEQDVTHNRFNAASTTVAPSKTESFYDLNVSEHSHYAESVSPSHSTVTDIHSDELATTASIMNSNIAMTHISSSSSHATISYNSDLRLNLNSAIPTDSISTILEPSPSVGASYSRDASTLQYKESTVASEFAYHSSITPGSNSANDMAPETTTFLFENDLMPSEFYASSSIHFSPTLDLSPTSQLYEIDISNMDSVAIRGSMSSYANSRSSLTIDLMVTNSQQVQATPSSELLESSSITSSPSFESDILISFMSDSLVLSPTRLIDSSAIHTDAYSVVEGLTFSPQVSLEVTSTQFITSGEVLLSQHEDTTPLQTHSTEAPTDNIAFTHPNTNTFSSETQESFLDITSNMEVTTSFPNITESSSSRIENLSNFSGSPTDYIKTASPSNSNGSLSNSPATDTTDASKTESPAIATESSSNSIATYTDDTSFTESQSTVTESLSTPTDSNTTGSPSFVFESLSNSTETHSDDNSITESPSSATESPSNSTEPSTNTTAFETFPNVIASFINISNAQLNISESPYYFTGSPTSTRDNESPSNFTGSLPHTSTTSDTSTEIASFPITTEIPGSISETAMYLNESGTSAEPSKYSTESPSNNTEGLSNFTENPAETTGWDESSNITDSLESEVDPLTTSASPLPEYIRSSPLLNSEWSENANDTSVNGTDISTESAVDISESTGSSSSITASGTTAEAFNSSYSLMETTSQLLTDDTVTTTNEAESTAEVTSLPDVTSEVADQNTEATTLSSVPTTTLSTTTKAAVPGPVLVSPPEQIHLNVGKYFEYAIPQDTFYSRTDGSTDKLQLRLLTYDAQPLQPDSWVLFDQQRQVIYGLPMTDKLNDTHAYLLTATDSTNQRAVTLIVIKVESSSIEPEPSHRFNLTLDYDYKLFRRSYRNLIFLVKLLSSYYGDTGTSNMTVLDVTLGSVILSWTNSSTSQTVCEKEVITSLYEKIYQEGITDTFKEFMFPYIPTGMTVEYLGVCSVKTVATTTGSSDTKMLLVSILVPLLVLFLGIFLLVCCCGFCRSRKRQEGNLGKLHLDGDVPTFAANRKPVLLEGELELNEMKVATAIEMSKDFNDFFEPSFYPESPIKKPPPYHGMQGAYNFAFESDDISSNRSSPPEYKSQRSSLNRSDPESFPPLYRLPPPYPRFV